MPFAFVFDMADMGQADYDELMKALNQESLDAASPSGLIAHLAGPTPNGGWRVLDLWESQEVADAYYSADLFQQSVGSAPFEVQTSPWPMHRAELETTLKHLG
ncbi:MAG TPA: hypothetical protein VGH85_17320 [Mycobacteriales bacterium]|jgi:hypothetical protein